MPRPADRPVARQHHADTPPPRRTDTAAADPAGHPAGPDRTGCDPSYPTVCIPPAPPDLDCGDIPYRRFPSSRPTRTASTANKNGIGCESG